MSIMDYQLLKQVASGDKRGVESLLTAGASIDGSRDLPTRPVVVASRSGQVGVLEMLICRGADLEVTSKEHIHFPLGSRALHAAVMQGHVGSVRCLMKAGANADVFNSAGHTPLMYAYYASEMVAELLKGGANPILANDQGTTALHVFAVNGAHDEPMQLLLDAAPSALSQATNPGYTPLACAAKTGVETSVAFLLAAGASDKALWRRLGVSSLWMAVENGHENIVRMLVNAGMRAIGGGSTVILGAMCRAAAQRQARILDMLLGVEGEARKKYWTRQLAGNIPILHHATMYGSLTTVHVCLAAGADENSVNGTGLRASQVMGTYAPPNTQNKAKLREAIGRMLQRGPAFRARSWAWPPKRDAAGIGASLVTAPPTIGRLKTGLRVFRASNERLFKTCFARYSQKK